MSPRRPIARGLLASVVLCLAGVFAATAAMARADAPAGAVAAQALPAEARATLDRIPSGGPFPYQRDGVVFGNREHIAPRESRAGIIMSTRCRHPGRATRGARRIVCGGATRRR